MGRRGWVETRVCEVLWSLYCGSPQHYDRFGDEDSHHIGWWLLVERSQVHVIKGIGSDGAHQHR